MNEIWWETLAGTLSSAIFVASTLPMLLKAIRTKDLHSYSFGNILLANLGNAMYWIYVAALPYGPVYFLHGFNSLSTFFMLIWYLRFGRRALP
jgi:hypothetical protein